MINLIFTSGVDVQKSLKNYTKWKTLHSWIKFMQLFYVFELYPLTILSNELAVRCINIGFHCLLVPTAKAACVLNSRLHISASGFSSYFSFSFSFSLVWFWF